MLTLLSALPAPHPLLQMYALLRSASIKYSPVVLPPPRPLYWLGRGLTPSSFKWFISLVLLMSTFLLCLSPPCRHWHKRATATTAAYFFSVTTATLVVAIEPDAFNFVSFVTVVIFDSTTSIFAHSADRNALLSKSANPSTVIDSSLLRSLQPLAANPRRSEWTVT